MKRLMVALAGALTIFGLVAASNAASPFTFDGAPSAPAPYTTGFLDGWDVQVHDRDAAEHPGQTASMVAMHGADCGAPPATHVTSGSVADAVFQCANHIMTATDSDTTGYSVIYLTPPEMVDFSNGGSVTFELSTLKTSLRDWWDLTVSPFMDSQALPLLSALSEGVDLAGPNRNSVVITAGSAEGVPALDVVTNGNDVGYGPPGWAGDPISAGVTATNQAATRQTFKLTMSTHHVKFERLQSATAPALVFIDQEIPALTWTQGVVQFGHHSYTPTKDGAGTPNTWHWDNISLSPNVPIYIGAFTSRWTQGGTIVATQPAPANSYLRFSAICKPVIDGVPGTKMTVGNEGHFSSYLMPVAEGSQSWNVGFAQDGYYPYGGLHCLAKDYSIFSLSTSSTPTSTPQATSTSTVPATATSTPVPPTATPTTANTATPAATSTATPTRTPTPATYRCQRRNANGTWTTLWTSTGGSCP